MGSAYSPEKRTALVFCGSGAHGAYHAGTLRALQEAGVKIDIVAGHGIGAATAALAAIDGGARLWEQGGLWRNESIAGVLPWRWPLRAAGWLLLVLVGVLVLPLLLLALGLVSALPLLVPRIGLAIILILVLTLFGAVTMARRQARVARRVSGRWWWRLVGAPFDPEPLRTAIGSSIWQLIRGAGGDAPPASVLFGRRLSEVLAENLGQPGFRELMIVTSDLDTRRDLVAALLREPYRQEFVAARAGRERRSEVLDLAGAGRDHAIDMVSGAVTPPLGAEPHLMTFAPDSYWRGETHRVCDRPGAVSRLLEELAAAGVSQAIVVSAVATVSAPHRLASPRIAARHRIGEFVEVSESAALRDALEGARLRFDAIYTISPAHNPVGPFDFGGAYDEASDRKHTLQELMERAYEDAYHQFIEPVVGASGDQLASVPAQQDTLE